MKNNLMFIMFLAGVLVLSAQKKEKIEGNKIIAEVFKDLPEFSQLEITDDLNISISQSTANGYHLTTDENLVTSIIFSVEDDVLHISTSKKITKSKKLNISLSVIALTKITLKDDAKLTSNSMLNFEDLKFYAYDNSSYELDVQAAQSSLILNNGSKGKLNLRGEHSVMLLNDNAFLKGKLILSNLEVTINKRADMNLVGDVENLNITSTGSSDIKAKNLKSTYTVLNTSNSADVDVFASKELKLYAKGKSAVYVYGNPEIKMEGLNDKSKVIKK